MEQESGIDPRRAGSLTLGPVIGMVTDTTARILVECQPGGMLTCLLTGPGGDVVQSQVNAQPHRPVVFPFSGLRPKTQYQVQVPGFGHPPSKFSTFSHHPTREEGLTFAVLACNKIRITREDVDPATDVWLALAEELQGNNFDLCIHVGDQIYADDDMGKLEKGKKTFEEIVKYSSFAQCLALLEQTEKSQWATVRPQLIERFRSVYRTTWGHPPTALALANCPNLFVYDDHEIRDDLGDKPEHLEPGPVRLVLECGRKACVEYQRQLMGPCDIGDEYDAPRFEVENHVIGAWGEYAILMLDSRGAKTFNFVPGDARPFLGSPQWTHIYEALRPGGLCDNCKILILGAQIPLFFFDKAWTERLAPRGDDFEGHWSFGNNQVEQLELLTLLDQWLLRDPQRNLVLAGGDMHLGGYSNIYRGGEYTCQQLLVGPVSNRCPKAAFMVGSGIINKIASNMGNGWQYKHFGWFSARNVGVIRTRGAPPEVTVGHLKASKKKHTVSYTWAKVPRTEASNRARRSKERAESAPGHVVAGHPNSEGPHTAPFGHAPVSQTILAPSQSPVTGLDGYIRR